MKTSFFVFSLLYCCFSFSQNTKNKSTEIIRYDCKKEDLVVHYESLSPIPDYEKAAIAFVSLHDSRDCEWDGKANFEHSNLSCKITKILGLGYQCSEKHIALLKQWFQNDSSAQEEIKYCPMTPNGAHSVQGVNRITLTKINTDKFKVDYSISGVNIRRMATWSLDIAIVFKKEKNELKILSRKEYNVKKESFAEPEDH